jgi:hypothetical protein
MGISAKNGGKVCGARTVLDRADAPYHGPDSILAVEPVKVFLVSHDSVVAFVVRFLRPDACLAGFDGARGWCR